MEFTGQLTSRLECAAPDVARLYRVEDEDSRACLPVPFGFPNLLEDDYRRARLDEAAREYLRPGDRASIFATRPEKRVLLG